MLTRRHLILSGLALAALPSAGAAQVRAYTPGMAEAAMRDGARIVLIFGGGLVFNLPQARAHHRRSARILVAL